MPLAQYASTYLEPVLASLTSNRRPSTGIEIILPGGGKYQFNGKYNPLRSAPREIEVLPGRGSRNRVVIEPATPITTAPRSTPMPAKKTLRLGRIWFPSMGTDTEAMLKQMDSDWAQGNEIQAQYRGLVQAWHDSMCLDLTLPLPQTQLDALRARLGTNTRVQTRTPDQEGPRTRIHGWSRVRFENPTRGNKTIF